MKMNYYFALISTIFSFEAMAFYSSSTMLSLDDIALSQVVGQVGKLSLPNPDQIQREQMHQTIRLLTEVESSASIDTFNKIFQTMANGQIKMQIDREVVSIGVIEFRLHMDGFAEMGDSMMDQIRF